MVNEEQKPQRGQVWLVDFGPQPGHRVQGIRPAIIVSNDLGNKFSPVVSVVPLSTQLHKKPIPVHVTLLSSETGLERDSLVLCEQLCCLNKDDLRNFITSLNREQMRQIEEAILIHTGISR